MHRVTVGVIRSGLTIKQTKYMIKTISGITQKYWKLMSKDNIESAFPNVEIILRMFFNINGYDLCSRTLIFSIESYKKSK